MQALQSKLKEKIVRAFCFSSFVVLCAAFAAPVLGEDTPAFIKLSEIKWGPCDPKTPQDPCQIDYFRGNPEKEANHSFFRVPKGHEFTAHWHTHNEHIVVTKGTFAIGGEGDAKGTTLRAGEYAYVPAKWIHWGKCLEGECVVYLHVDGPDSYIDVKERRP